MLDCVDAYLGLGSNIDPEVHLSEAVAVIREHDTVTGVSSVWRTPPVGVGAGTSWYLNAVVRLSTTRSAYEIITVFIPLIEQSLGRIRDPHIVNAPRTIDVDLLIYGETVDEVAGHTLPDPDITRHAHVAVPLNDLAPELVVSSGDRTVAQIAASLSHASRGIVRHDLTLVMS